MRAIRLRRVLAGVLCAVLCAALAVLGAGTVPAAGEVAEGQPLLWGAYADKRPGSMSQGSLAQMEDTADRKLGVVREFMLWDTSFPDDYHLWLRDNGYPAVFSVKSRMTDGTPVRYADVAAAQPGSRLYAEIAGWADKMRDYGVPLYFAYTHEPEAKANLDLGEAPDFIAAWRNVHKIFQARGATNVKFIWIMTDYSFMVGTWARNHAPKWYPGDAYLDAMGADAYNWFTCRDGISNQWKSLEQIIRPFRDFGALHPDEEMWLTEYATVEDPAVPGRKEQWFRDAQALFKRSDYSQFVGLSYFDRKGVDNCVWHVDTSASSISGFRAMGADTFYGGTLTPPPPPDPDPVEVSFVAAASTNANKAKHAVQVPAAVQPGDTMVLFFTGNSNPATTTPPTGWTEVDRAEVDGLRGRVWVRTATAGDAGTTVSVSSSAITKADLMVAAYRGLDADPVDVHALTVETTTSSRRTAPSVTTSAAGDWLLVYWADKSSTNTGHTVPASQTKRRSTTGSGGGHITATVADSSTGVPQGPTGTFTAVGTATSGRAVMYTIALRPSGE